MSNSNLNVLKTRRKTKNEIECTADVLNSSAITTRHLKRDELKEWYTEDEVDTLLHDTDTLSPTLSDIRYEDAFNEFLAECKENNSRRIWTVAEDDFIRRNYKHLSDSTIALALNIPSQNVIDRRMYLKLEKGQRTSEYEIPLIVWADRNKFDEDCKKFHLTKARSHA